RNIVVREREEEARRDEAKKLILAEMARLKIKSASLTRQIEFLAQPVTTLISHELALLQEPVMPAPDHSLGAFKPTAIPERLPAAPTFVAASRAHPQYAHQASRRISPGSELLKSLDLSPSRAVQFAAFAVILVALVQARRKSTAENPAAPSCRKRCTNENPGRGETFACECGRHSHAKSCRMDAGSIASQCQRDEDNSAENERL
ncbi:MAG TPA: hypothetical protein VFA65_08590, partial [Bryobacteraceae bacterium]|nr:hypothetical protein [Bryobacteraceae bacterium]